ncbi:MAG: putative toxin-antitoxin system toxin component, PIN family [Rhodoferax sp.]|uniref:putative toxin-antitoxin system toxin component, PIN family n=1 Tax=Rhodoferax sp. TaxID=50421 RepID=UPI002609B58F|nr:putative toxin-antitoxin system toxin component, PIN family [Rhodoferax sp.]MDD2883184.1 putative toxin-antitoxin system toxin component, PIN family [Rhodoferax sp.]
MRTAKQRSAPAQHITRTYQRRTGTDPAQLVVHVLAHGLPVVTANTVAELRSRLWKPKFDRYISLEQRHALLHDLEACAYWAEVSPALRQQTFSRDPDDDAFIHVALASQARWLVTGGDNLLVLADTLPFAIVKPAQALRQLSQPDFIR